MPTASKGSETRPIASLGFDSDTLLELVEIIVAEINRLGEAMMSQLGRLSKWSKSVEARPQPLPENDLLASIVKLISGDESLTALRSLRDFLVHSSTYESRLEELKEQRQAATPELSGGDTGTPNEEEAHLSALRAEVLAAIPQEVWEAARKGFGDPDLANV